METKKCNKCGEVKDIIEFGKDKHVKNGLKSTCKKCKREEYKEWRMNNQDKAKEASNKWKANNKEKVIDTARLWRIKNKDKIKEYNNNWHIKNPDFIKNYSKDWYHKNIEKAKNTQKKSRIKHREKRSEENKEWKTNNPERIKIYRRNSVKELNKSYITKTLKNSGFTTNQINENPELIEVKRLIIKTKRLCKTSQNLEKV